MVSFCEWVMDFDSSFSAHGAAAIGLGFDIHQFHRPVQAGVGCAVAGIVLLHPAFRVERPTGIVTAIVAANHVTKELRVRSFFLFIGWNTQSRS